MILIYGTRLFGKVDKVDDVLYVATRFFHIWYVPLIPLGSYVVLKGSESSDGWHGVPLSFSWKSALFGWLRGAGVVAGLGGLVGAVANMGLAPLEWMAPLLVSAMGIAGFTATWLFDKADAERAAQLAQQLGLPPEHVESLRAQAGALPTAAETHGGGPTTPTGA